MKGPNLLRPGTRCHDPHNRIRVHGAHAHLCRNSSQYILEVAALNIKRKHKMRDNERFSILYIDNLLLYLYTKALNCNYAAQSTWLATWLTLGGQLT